MGLQSERSGVRSSLGSPCCILEQDTLTSQKVLIIPRKQWLRPDMTEKIVDLDVIPQPKQTKHFVAKIDAFVQTGTLEKRSEI